MIRRSLVFVFAIAPLIGGCGPPAVPRAITFGQVTFDGEPIETGHIRFLISGKPTAQAPINGGKYRIEFRGGVPVGTGKVQIEAASKTRQMIDVGVDKPPVALHQQVIPERYNKQTELTAEIIADKENEINFDLEP